LRWFHTSVIINFLMKNLNKKWFWFAVLGLVLVGAGLSVVGEAIIAKTNHEAWFLFGTLGLILVNSGLCFFGTAVGFRFGKYS
jgi:uncharacterized membrane protein HdeD (DUF308 family)